MIGRIIVVLFLYTVLFSYDLKRLKKQPKKIRYIYTILIAISIYAGLSFIFEANWPNIVDLINAVLLKPAEQIVKYLTTE